MRSIGSLLNAGYTPKYGIPLYRVSSEVPAIIFCRFKEGYKRIPIWKPYDVDPQPEALYLHPYFPNKPITAVKVLKSMPWAKVGFIYTMENDYLVLKDHVSYDEKTIYLYPTFFQPIYKN